MMKEIHGVADCERIAAVNSIGHKVTVADGDIYVILSIADQAYPAGLTPARALCIAKFLRASAARVQKKINARKQPK